MKTSTGKPLLVALLISWGVWVTTGLLLPFVGYIPNDIPHEGNQTTNKNPPANNMPIIFRIGNFIDEHNGVFTALATIAIAYFTLLLKGVSTDQHRMMEKQTDISAATERAWLSTQMTVDGPIVFDDLKASLPIKYIIQNVGRIPAHCSQPDFFVYPEMTDDEVLKPYRARVETKKIFPSLEVYTIFPGGFWNVATPAAVGRDLLDRNRPMAIIKDKIYFVVEGIVPYTYPGNGKIHWTPFRFNISLIDRTDPQNRNIMPIVLGTIPQSELLVTSDYIEGRAT